MSLYQRANSPYWWIRLPAIKGEIKPLRLSAETANKKQAQQLHDKLKAERWEVDKLDQKPKRTWDEAAARFLEETTHKRTQAWDISMLKWFQPYLGGKELKDINKALIDHVRAVRAKGVSDGTICAIPSPLGIGRRALQRMNCSVWVAGKPWKWWSGMPTLRRRACKLRPVGWIMRYRAHSEHMKKPPNHDS